MRRLGRSVSLFLLLSGFASEAAHAQLIQVERGYVRTPLLRVGRKPGERGFVRTPLVGIGGAANPTPYAPQGQPALNPPMVPPAEMPQGPDVADMDWQALRQRIVTGETELDAQLHQVGGGDRWRQKLEVGNLGQTLASESNEPPSARERSQLQRILTRYQQASINRALRPVTQLSGFRTVVETLSEYVQTPEERQRGRLVTASMELDRALRRMQNGRSWMQHLRLPESVFLPGDAAGNHIAQVDEPDEQFVKDLSQALSRFDAASEQPRFRAVTTLAEFQAAHEHLQMYVDFLREPETVTEDVHVIRQRPADPQPTLANPS